MHELDYFSHHQTGFEAGIGTALNLFTLWNIIKIE